MPAASLYVHRPLINGHELRGWAASIGLPVALPATDMHVTVAFSRAAVDWNAIPPHSEGLVVPVVAGRVQRLGTATVLRFPSVALTDRWRALRRAGAFWDWPEYHPHVTLTYQPPAGFDPAKAPPFAGFLYFGPEHWRPLDEGWKGQVVETPTSAGTIPLAAAAS